MAIFLAAFCIADRPLASEPMPELSQAAASVPASDVLTVVPESDAADRLWVINTRHLCLYACCAPLESPDFRVSRLGVCGQLVPADLAEYLATRQPGRPTVIYVHGNRMQPCDAIQRGLFVYRQLSGLRGSTGPIDWVIWSWPSEQSGILGHDVREKARRTDAQGLYLAELLREHVGAGQPTALIGYSFGGRIVSGSLHALAGGALAGRTLPGPAVIGAPFDVGMVAPAMENDWMAAHGYHRFATKNIDRLILMYNRSDAILRNYWRISRVRNADALGYTGPQSFAARADGSTLPVLSRDCAPTVGRRHYEVDYYKAPCRADCQLAKLIAGSLTPTP